METALYGRMKTGKCIPNHLDYVGCKSEVLPRFDEKCSGKRKCEVLVTDKEIPTLIGCMKGVMRYLEADYSCKKGKLSKCF